MPPGERRTLGSDIAGPPPLAFAAGLAAATLFALSLLLPVAVAQQTQGLNTISGLELLFIGALGPLAGQFGWYATPCLIVAIILLLRRRPLAGRLPAVLAVAMLLLLIDALSWNDYPNDGGSGPIVHYGAGYFAWVTAVVTGIAGLAITRFGTGVRS